MRKTLPSQQTWSGFSPTTVPDNDRQSELSPMTDPKMSQECYSFRKIFVVGMLFLGFAVFQDCKVYNGVRNKIIDFYLFWEEFFGYARKASLPC